MKFIFTLIFGISLFSLNTQAQFSTFTHTDETLYGFNFTVTSMKNPSLLYVEGQKVGPYVGIGVDITRYSYEPWKLRYQLEMKWITDLGFKAYEFFTTGLNAKDTARLDFSGLVWFNMGTNLYSTEHFNIGIGGNFSDCVLDIPNFTFNGNSINGQTLDIGWQEPSGWHWTAGPTLFADACVGSFAFTLTSSYNFSFWNPIINNAYEERIDQIEGYPPPQFWFLDITANHKSGFYVSFDITKVIDTGINQNKISRNDLQIGWRF